MSSNIVVIAIKLQNGPDGQIHNTGMNENEHPLASEKKIENLNRMQHSYENLERNSSYMSSMNVSSNLGSLENGNDYRSYSPNHNSLPPEKQVSTNADSSSPALVRNLDVNSRSRTRNSDHENLDQSVHEKVTNCRNIAADVQRNSKENTSIINSGNTLSQGGSAYIGKNPGSVNYDTSECNDKLNGRYEEPDKLCAKEGGGDKIYYGLVEDVHVNEKFSLKNYMEDEQSVAQGAKEQVLLGSTIYSSERLKNMQSARSPADSARNHAEVKENGSLGDSKNSGGTIRSNDKKDAKIYPKVTRNASLDGKIEHLENKIKMLEGELREAAAIEAALYSVVAEHGSSMGKLHAPARRLSRLYLHACKENLQVRKSGAAKSSVSGLVLVAKACGNDVPRYI